MSNKELQRNINKKLEGVNPQRDQWSVPPDDIFSKAMAEVTSIENPTKDDKFPFWIVGLFAFILLLFLAYFNFSPSNQIVLEEDSVAAIMESTNNDEYKILEKEIVNQSTPELKSKDIIKEKATVDEKRITQNLQERNSNVVNNDSSTKGQILLTKTNSRIVDNSIPTTVFANKERRKSGSVNKVLDQPADTRHQIEVLAINGLDIETLSYQMARPLLNPDQPSLPSIASSNKWSYSFYGAFPWVGLHQKNSLFGPSSDRFSETSNGRNINIGIQASKEIASRVHLINKLSYTYQSLEMFDNDIAYYQKSKEMDMGGDMEYSDVLPVHSPFGDTEMETSFRVEEGEMLDMDIMDMHSHIIQNLSFLNFQTGLALDIYHVGKWNVRSECLLGVSVPLQLKSEYHTTVAMHHKTMDDQIWHSTDKLNLRNVIINKTMSLGTSYSWTKNISTGLFYGFSTSLHSINKNAGPALFISSHNLGLQVDFRF